MSLSSQAEQDSLREVVQMDTELEMIHHWESIKLSEEYEKSSPGKDVTTWFSTHLGTSLPISKSRYVGKNQRAEKLGPILIIHGKTKYMW